MFVILTYDVKAKRDAKILKICRRYLSHEQKSVFEGIITEAKLAKLKKELTKQINISEDSINIYEFSSMKYSVKEQIGVNKNDNNII